MSKIKQLFSGKKNKDEDSRRLIFNLYYKLAYNAAYFYCGDASTSEEAAQEAIYKAIQNIGQLRDHDKIEAWIKKISINNVNTIINKKKKIVSLDNTTSIAASNEDNPEYIVESRETLEAVGEAIESLDPSLRQVVYLHYYQGKKIKEIASMLGKPEGTVKTILHRARRNIKSRLARKGYISLEPKGGEKHE